MEPWAGPQGREQSLPFFLCLLGLAVLLWRLALTYHSDLTRPSNLGTKLILYLLGGKPNKQAQNSKKTGVNKSLMNVIVSEIVKGGMSW